MEGEENAATAALYVPLSDNDDDDDDGDGDDDDDDDGSDEVRPRLIHPY